MNPSSMCSNQTVLSVSVHENRMPCSAPVPASAWRRLYAGTGLACLLAIQSGQGARGAEMDQQTAMHQMNQVYRKIGDYVATTGSVYSHSMPTCELPRLRWAYSCCNEEHRQQEEVTGSVDLRKIDNAYVDSGDGYAHVRITCPGGDACDIRLFKDSTGTNDGKYVTGKLQMKRENSAVLIRTKDPQAAQTVADSLNALIALAKEKQDPEAEFRNERQEIIDDLREALRGVSNDRIYGDYGRVDREDDKEARSHEFVRTYIDVHLDRCELDCSTTTGNGYKELSGKEEIESRTVSFSVPLDGSVRFSGGGECVTVERNVEFRVKETIVGGMSERYPDGKKFSADLYCLRGAEELGRILERASKQMAELRKKYHKWDPEDEAKWRKKEETIQLRDKQYRKDSFSFMVSGLAPGDSLNIRSGPGSNNPAAGLRLHNGSYVKVLGKAVRNDADDWLPISCGPILWIDPKTHTTGPEHVKGWVNAKYIVDASPPQAKVPAAGQPAKPNNETASVPAKTGTPAGATRAQPWVNSLGMQFVPVPGMPGILMCRTETRVKDFRAYAVATGYRQQGGMEVPKIQRDARGGQTLVWQEDPAASWQKPGFAQDENHPVVGVSWEEARTFCQWLGHKEGIEYRLPQDAEWSAALGGGKYPWGDSWPPPAEAGNYSGREVVGKNTGGDSPTAYNGTDAYPFTAPVASFGENRNGFFDLGGNVWEWCEDLYQPSMNSSDVLAACPSLNKARADDGTAFRVLRGGSWVDREGRVGLLSACRGVDHPRLRYPYDGFRVVVRIRGK